MKELWVATLSSGSMVNMKIEVGIVDTSVRNALERLRDDPEYGDWNLLSLVRSPIRLILHDDGGIELGDTNLHGKELTDG